MELMLTQGDYATDHRGIPRALDGVGDIIERAMRCLRARRGTFPLLPDFGSTLHLLRASSAAESDADAMVREALAGIDEIRVSQVRAAVGNESAQITILLTIGETNYQVKAGVALG